MTQGNVRIAQTVLVVDDNPAIRRHVCATFLSCRFTACVDAEDGKQAIEVARELKPDIIILDLSMPVMNGLEAAPTLKKLFPETPIILFTLFGDQLQATELASLGISATVQKSDPLDELLHKAGELMDTRNRLKGATQ